MAFDTPIALLVFNRPEQTRRVFAEVAKVRPRKLLIVADGPRSNVPGEVERCAEVRGIVEAVDWECTVLRHYADLNLGCRRRVSSGLDWVFSQCEEAIILEDDCLPHPTFFRFCEDLLDRFRDNERVMMISGDSFYVSPSREPFSYRFSRYNFIWGWASWRRAWRHYDVSLSSWPALRETDWLRRITGSRASARYWRRTFDQVYRGEIDTWDYQWMFASWKADGMAVIPTVNLVTNIGFGEGATHTGGESRLANLPASAMEFPLRHPRSSAPDHRADRIVADQVFEWVVPSRTRLFLHRLRARLPLLVPTRTRHALRKLFGLPTAPVIPGSTP
ncbi:MAG TPA: hypothetical protein VHG28_08840 [Longimicrobiaceae bacterium]|nr:hypothetical protein [Longimicrobiaceae bacterium]